MITCIEDIHKDIDRYKYYLEIKVKMLRLVWRSGERDRYEEMKEEQNEHF